jgi:hypothetical protein
MLHTKTERQATRSVGSGPQEEEEDMNESDNKPQAIDNSTGALDAGQADVSSVARRRQVLRGLTSGAAIAAAGTPLSALATGGRKYCFHKATPHKKVKASVSGMQSTITSNMATGWTESPGKNCGYYKTKNNWPSDSGGQYCKGKNNAKFYRSTATFKDLFGCSGGGYNDWKIKDLLASDIAPHCNWITACLNATKLSDFSYIPADVVNLFHDPQKNLFALTFFRDYQENYSY